MKCGCGGKSTTAKEGDVYVDCAEPPYFRLTGEEFYTMHCDKCGGAVGGNSPDDCEAKWLDTNKKRKQRWSQLSVARYLEQRSSGKP